LTAPSRRSGEARAHRLLEAAADAALSKKAEDLVALDLRDLRGVADFFLICSAQSDLQVKAIAEAVEEKLKEHGTKPWHVEGQEGRRWVLLDYVELVVHVFHHRTREYYLLERLWGDARKVDLGLDPTD
jgi:ribosome-associated protein